MADVNKKQQTSETGTPQRGLETRDNRALSRNRGWDPLSSSLMPSDFFGTDPFSFMRRFHDEMDRRMAQIFGNESGQGAGSWRPAVEIAERNGQLCIHAELPGVKPEDVKVEATDNALVIHGERKDEHEENKSGVYRSERRYGSFYREIPLPEGVNAEQAQANFKDGVLEVTLPMPE